MHFLRGVKKSPWGRDAEEDLRDKEYVCDYCGREASRREANDKERRVDEYQWIHKLQ